MVINANTENLQIKPCRKYVIKYRPDFFKLEQK